jgi:uncharacterized lipoprotein NlpE involved in copper resistance
MPRAAPLQPPLPLPTAAAAALLALLLAGCGRGDTADDGAPSASGAAATALAEDFDGAWQGVLPCVDCAGLEVELSLRRASSEPARYTLVERYLGGAFDGEFASAGEWRETGCALGDEVGACIVLVDAAQQWFRHEDGSLEAISSDGLPLDPEGARLARL